MQTVTDEQASHAADTIAARLRIANANTPKRPPEPAPMPWCIACQQFHYPPRDEAERAQMRCEAPLPATHEI